MKPRFLIVDDCEEIRALIKQYLPEGSIVDEAEDGWKALAHLHTKSYDVIISDCEMKRMSGPEFIRILRGTGDTTPIFILSSSPMAESIGHLVQGVFSKLDAVPLLNYIRIACQNIRA